MQAEHAHASVSQTRRRFERVAHGPWLQHKSLASVVRKVCSATGCVILLLVVLFGMANSSLVSDPADVPEGIGIVFSIIAIVGLFASGWCVVMWAHTVWDRRNRQYCPDCLSYMSRGAHVCPFCGFRDDVSAPPSVAPQPAK